MMSSGSFAGAGTLARGSSTISAAKQETSSSSTTLMKNNSSHSISRGGTVVGTIRLVSLLPPGPNIRLADYKPVVQAGIDARFYRDISKKDAAITDVIVGPDAEVGGESVELIGTRVRLDIPCMVAKLPFLVCQIRDTGRFCGLEILVQDTNGKAYSLLATNKSSSVRITSKTCAMPLDLTPGWNIVRIDLVDVLARAFAAEYAVCTGVIIHASCCVARLYFESRPFEDFELPEFLRTVKRRGEHH